MRRIRDSLIKKTGGNIDSATLAKATGYTIRDVDRLLNMEDKPVLLNAPVGDSGEDLVECFAAAEEESTDDIEERMKIISASMKNLSKREREIIKAYYGFESDVPQTLSEIGKRYGISRERVRQIKINAMRRMRHTLKLNKASEK
jgi:RNA polymerase sigma factor (sigma-70 family)